MGHMWVDAKLQGTHYKKSVCKERICINLLHAVGLTATPTYMGHSLFLPEYTLCVK